MYAKSLKLDTDDETVLNNLFKARENTRKNIRRDSRKNL